MVYAAGIEGGSQASCLGLDAETQQVGLQVDAALVAAQHVKAEEEVRALLHDRDAHGQVLGAYLGVHLCSMAENRTAQLRSEASHSLHSMLGDTAWRTWTRLS